MAIKHINNTHLVRNLNEPTLSWLNIVHLMERMRVEYNMVVNIRLTKLS